MRAVVALAACFGLATVVAGCSSVDGDYLRVGIGTDLGTPDLPQVSYLQDVYIGEICRQAGLRVLQQGDVLVCDEVGMRPGEWATFVQAGMNDIDRRCDAYLAWLDNKRRWREPVLAQLHSTAAATAAILGLTKVGAVPIAIVATSFGFAQESFLNFQSRLITQIDQSVVQSVVLGHQNEFRLKVAGLRVDNRPAAAYLLRNYLRICMPFSIEMSINNTITTFHRGGSEALREAPLLTRAPTVARETTRAAPRPTIIRDVNAPLAKPAGGPRPPPTDTKLATYEPGMSGPDMRLVLDTLCRPKTEVDLGPAGSPARKVLAMFLMANGRTSVEVLNRNAFIDIQELKDEGKTACSRPLSTANKLGPFEPGVSGPDMRLVLDTLCRPRTEVDLGPAGSPARKVLATFLMANGRTSVEILNRNAFIDIQELNGAGKRAC